MENMVNQEFWKNKRVLITGHTGFKGGWLTLWLWSMGAKVYGFSHEPPTTPNFYDLVQLNKLATTTIGDIRDLPSLRNNIEKCEPEIVIHCAAQALVRLSYDEPVSTYETNVLGSVNLLEAVRSCHSVKAVIMITSDKCYENREWVWGYRENEPMGGYDPYSNSKGCAELAISAYRSSFFNPNSYANHGVGIASVRAGNVIGGGDWAKDRLIPDFVKAMAAGNELTIRSPEAIRPWQHVLEPLSGYLLLAQKLYENGQKYSEGWNFGPNDHDAKTVSWIVNELVNMWGENASYKIDKDPHLHEANYLKLDISKARNELGWEPKWDIGKALEKVVAWYKAFYQSDDLVKMSIRQIDEYMS